MEKNLPAAAVATSVFSLGARWYWYDNNHIVQSNAAAAKTDAEYFTKMSTSKGTDANATQLMQAKATSILSASNAAVRNFNYLNIISKFGLYAAAALVVAAVIDYTIGFRNIANFIGTGIDALKSKVDQW